MKIVIQRCSSAKCIIDDKVYSEIDKGLVLLVGFGEDDLDVDLDYYVNKICNMRIFEDDMQKMNLSVQDIGGKILSISQFTLYAETKKGNRPSFTKSLDPINAKKLYEEFNEKLNKQVTTLSGVFASDMKIDFINDGPVTIIM